MAKAKVNEFWVSGFTADTQVVMANGDIKPISKIQEGEWVRSFNPATRESNPGRVTGTWAEVMTDILEVSVDDDSMLVAASQLFYTPKGAFKTAPDAEGVVTVDGAEKTISSKKFRGGKVKLYDITVQGNHSFIANGLMVHNKGEKAPPPPPPPPDPVVTAGKVGQPLSINVNGTTVIVNPPPGNVATVSVNYQGGASTGYSSVPGVANINPPMPVPTYPTANYGTSAYNYLVAAISEQINVCNSLSDSDDYVSPSAKAAWQSSLDRLRVDVQQASRNDKLWWATPGVRFTATVSSPPDLAYQDTINGINDLRKFVSKEKSLSAGDRSFIAAKCAEIGDELDFLSARLRPGDVAIPQPSVSGSSDRIYSTNPTYGYATKTGNVGGCSVYAVRPPNSYSNGPTYFKHFDSNVGQFYLSTNSDNCI